MDDQSGRRPEPLDPADEPSLRRRLAGLERENQALRELEVNRTRILSNVSHELRTPLVTVIGYVEMVLQGQLGAVTPEVERALRVVLRNALRQSNLIDDLLNLSRLQEGEFELNPERLALGPVLDEVTADNRFLLQEKEVELHQELDPDLPPLLSDRRLTRILLENLLKNAVKFNRPGGNVWVSARAEGQRLHLSVRDDGTGVPEAIREQVFVPFFQADSSPTRTYGGVGAGLALAKRIVEAHGGSIRLDPAEGGGTLVRFDLPAAL